MTDGTSDRISGLEAKARREALGVSGTLLAEMLPWKQASLAGAEAGRRRVAPHVPVLLERLERVRDDLAEDAYTRASAGELVLLTWRDDAEMWNARPELAGVPACVHRVAMAAALCDLRADGVSARIVEAHVSGDG
jgi:hypothetical protein